MIKIYEVLLLASIYLLGALWMRRRKPSKGKKYAWLLLFAALWGIGWRLYADPFHVPVSNEDTIIIQYQIENERFEELQSDEAKRRLPAVFDALSFQLPGQERGAFGELQPPFGYIQQPGVHHIFIYIAVYRGDGTRFSIDFTVSSHREEATKCRYDDSNGDPDERYFSLLDDQPLREWVQAYCVKDKWKIS